MKNIKDYFGTKTAIKCENEQQWEKLKELCGTPSSTFNWEYPCFSLSPLGGQCKKMNPLYQILPYSDFVSDVPELVAVEMEVSNNGEYFFTKKVIGKLDNVYITCDFCQYGYARPITKKVLTATLTELAEMLNVDEIQLK